MCFHYFLLFLRGHLQAVAEILQWRMQKLFYIRTRCQAVLFHIQHCWVLCRFHWWRWWWKRGLKPEYLIRLVFISSHQYIVWIAGYNVRTERILTALVVTCNAQRKPTFDWRVFVWWFHTQKPCLCLYRKDCFGRPGLHSLYSFVFIFRGLTWISRVRLVLEYRQPQCSWGDFRERHGDDDSYWQLRGFDYLQDCHGTFIVFISFLIHFTLKYPGLNLFFYEMVKNEEILEEL